MRCPSAICALLTHPAAQNTRKFLRDEDGATAVEYAVMLALMIGAFFLSIQLVGQETQDSFNDSSSKIDEAFTESGL